MKAFQIIWLSSIHLLYNACVAQPPLENAIEVSKIKEYSFVVSLARKPINGIHSLQIHFCSGTVVTNKHVLTTGTCLRGKFPLEVQVFGGSNDIRFCDGYDISSWITHNTWAIINDRSEESRAFDIAVMTLAREVDGSKIEPVSISPKPAKNYYGLVGTSVVWSDHKNKALSGFIETSQVGILTKDQCSSKSELVVTKRAVETETIFCSSLNPSLSRSNEGGPILLGNNILVGINLRPDLDSPYINRRKANYHNSLYNYRKFFYDATAGAQILVA